MASQWKARYVLDASALLEVILEQPGANVVERALTAGALITTVNLSELLSSRARKGVQVKATVQVLEKIAELNRLRIEPFTEKEAVRAAEYTPPHRKEERGLADRCFLATVKERRRPGLTSEPGLLTFAQSERVQLATQVVDIRAPDVVLPGEG